MIESSDERALIFVSQDGESAVVLAAHGRFFRLEIDNSHDLEDWILPGPKSREPGMWVFEGTAHCHTFESDCEPRWQGDWRRPTPAELHRLCKRGFPWSK